MLILNDNRATTKVKPFVKWTGGKYDEFQEFSALIPAFNNYYEPFFGGGGVFFAMQPQGLSFLNDKSSDLIKFYQLIGSSEFKLQLEEYASAWEQATIFAKEVCENLLKPFLSFLNNKNDKTTLSTSIVEYFNNISYNSYNPLFSPSFVIYLDLFKNALMNSLLDKFNRIKNIQIKEQKEFNEQELLQHIETGVKSGLYLFLRSLTNKLATKHHDLPLEKAIANWYFVREFCYASMFRFNKKGEFNIPYGGIAYNSKNFRGKVDAIFSSKAKELFKDAYFFNLDFEVFLDKTAPTENDFIFLDPPYDPEFSEYDQNSFTINDQIRLRDCIKQCKAKCMLVIKETEFIKDIYSSSFFKIVDFDKTYTYNVRGRNDRGTKHLIILNYDTLSTI